MAKKLSASVATGATLTADVNVSGVEYLTVIAIAGPTATAAGDISVVVAPYTDEDGASAAALTPLTLPTADAVAAVLSNNKAWVLARVRVAGLRKVQIQAKNNNVGALPVEIDWQTG